MTFYAIHPSKNTSHKIATNRLKFSDKRMYVPLSVTLKEPAFCPHCVFTVCVRYDSLNALRISAVEALTTGLYDKMDFVLCDVENEVLCII